MSNNLDLDQIAGTQLNKHVTANDQSGQIDAALTEVLQVLVDDTNAATLTSAQFRRHQFFSLIDAGTPPDGAVTVTVPAIKRGLFVVLNATAQTVTVEVAGQSETAPAIAAGENLLLSCDGASVRAAGGGGAVATLGDIGDVDTAGVQQGHMLRRNGSNQWVAEDAPYDLGLFLPGTYSAGALMAQFVFDRAATFPENLANSQGYSGVTATGSTVLDVQKNGSNIGTITFTNAGNTAAFSLAGGISFAAGDRLSIVNEDPADATLADVSLMLAGKRD